MEEVGCDQNLESFGCQAQEWRDSSVVSRRPKMRGGQMG